MSTTNQHANDSTGKPVTFQMPTSFVYYEDPSHGWLHVPYQALEVLQIQNMISAYSYRSGDDAYLEEDCDALQFIMAYLRHIGRDAKDFQYFFAISSTQSSNTPSFIRNLPHYS